MILFSAVDLHPWGCNVDPGKGSPDSGTGLEGHSVRGRRRRGGKREKGRERGGDMVVNLREKGRKGKTWEPWELGK